MSLAVHRLDEHLEEFDRVLKNTKHEYKQLIENLFSYLQMDKPDSLFRTRDDDAQGTEDVVDPDGPYAVPREIHPVEDSKTDRVSCSLLYLIRYLNDRGYNRRATDLMKMVNLFSRDLEAQPTRAKSSLNQQNINIKVWDAIANHWNKKDRSLQQTLRLTADSYADRWGFPHPAAHREAKIKHIDDLPDWAPLLEDRFRLAESIYDIDEPGPSNDFDLSKTYKESKMTQSLISSLRQDSEVANIQPEAGYNNYGERGRIDLFAEHRPSMSSRQLRMIEMKSKYAVRESTGANEIIQQFNRMRESFLKGAVGSVFEPRTVHDEKYSFELKFDPCKVTIDHVFNYREMYYEAINNNIEKTDYDNRGKGGSPSLETESSISFYVPGGNDVPLFKGESRGHDIRFVKFNFCHPGPPRKEEFRRYVMSRSPEFHDEFWPLIENHL
jgi:hypothetical protein